MGNAGDQFFQVHGGHLRVRACGICIEDDRILLVAHQMPGREKLFWAPPGGGVQFGETLSATVQREFYEETGLHVALGKVLFLHEFLKPPLHALEIFLKIASFSGELFVGIDPELQPESQIIRQVRFMTWEQIQELHGDEKHQLFGSVNSVKEILQLKGIIGTG